MSRARRKPRLTQSPTTAAPATATGATGASLVDELRAEVKRVVVATTASTYPAVHARMPDLAGYQVVEDAIIQYVLFNQVTPSAALAQLETEWGGIS